MVSELWNYVIGGIVLGGNFPRGIVKGKIILGGKYPGGNFPRGNFLKSFYKYSKVLFLHSLHMVFLNWLYIACGVKDNAIFRICPYKFCP